MKKIANIVAFALPLVACGSAPQTQGAPDAVDTALVSSSTTTVTAGALEPTDPGRLESQSQTTAVTHGTPTLTGAITLGCRFPGGSPQLKGGSNIVPQMAIYNLGWGSVAAGGTANADTAFLADSSFMAGLGQYGIKSASFVIGQATGENPPSSHVIDTDVLELLDRMIPSKVPEDDGHILYVVYLPPGVSVDATDVGGGVSCVSSCGYHGHDTRPGHNGKRRYAVVTDPATCNGSCGSAAYRESVASHEIAETATDPDVGGWRDPNGGAEIGDICNAQVYTVNGFEMQCMWSNHDNTCIRTSQTAANGVGTPGANCTAAEFNAQNLGITSYWTCQNGNRYVCDGQDHKVVEVCPSGCASEGIGEDDQCNGGGGPMCTTAEFTAQNMGITSYWTCQGNSRYVCDGRGFKVNESCPNGCISEGVGVDDRCH